MSKCSKSGAQYEKEVHSILIKTAINDVPFNIQNEKELGSSSAKNDIVCTFDNKDIGIEIKRPSPDWMQCTLHYDKEKEKWCVSDDKRSKIPTECRDIFRTILGDMVLFDGSIPPFVNAKLTKEAWNKDKKEGKWKDSYKEIKDTTISELYRKKGCYYIQIDKYGLYHLGDDICNFGVPFFKIEQRIRIRVKVHGYKNGLCNLSVTAACQPVKLKDLEKSNFSLDSKDKLPNNLHFIN